MYIWLLRSCSGHAGIWRTSMMATHTLGSRLEIVHRLSNHIIHLVGWPWSVRIVISLEQVPRQITRRERPTRLVQRGSCSMNSFSDKRFLNCRHHRVSLYRSNLLLSQLLLLHLLLRGHHLACIRRILAAFGRASLPYSSFRHCLSNTLWNFQITN